ncbi:protein-L-isoaspartate(D-aspartate) O-methyltransferase [Prosthecomicrobium hirschii]|uniref:protein-L-isoaspartate(D-aspartate) O-methyltransferase n=1 Tax=Prosthecodimorpha hirschii TaxID=665126 RepID=UPI00222060F7|nr:protein-L-isoaspartate(D-aspartate) O-methyltransferase [Prosthecomicrobium hirschii]MCW1844023.1 protein-L-isoaspartate(D-aspartate) O-methyltransferase [Prosthecomicrobium hirschii]
MIRGLPTRPIDPAILAMDEHDRVRLARLVLSLRSRGVFDPAILSAIEQCPRKIFAAAEDRIRAFDDRPLAIECGQTATAPSTIGRILQHLKIGPDQRVLDIGTGSGFAAAVMARIARQVFTVERYRGLVDLALGRFLALRLGNLEAAFGDGLEGWADQAPFDRIHVAGSAPRIPDVLLSQLAPEGVLVMPVGEPGTVQQLQRVVRRRDGFHAEVLGAVRFVPLVPGRALVM